MRPPCVTCPPLPLTSWLRKWPAFAPKLQKPGDPARDFVIAEESSKGLAGVVNLIGIESPGLTASPAIARHVAALMANRE